MNDYVDMVWKKANAKTGILAKIRRFIIDKTAAMIYKTTIRPHLDFVDFVVESRSADRVKKLDTPQKKALRRIEYSMNKENRAEGSSKPNTSLRTLDFGEKETWQH